MFLDKSRYAKLATEDVATGDGRRVTALKLRRLPPTAGEPREVKDGDALDRLASECCGDATRFWHIADANSALEARELVAEAGARLRLPKS